MSEKKNGRPTPEQLAADLAVIADIPRRLAILNAQAAQLNVELRDAAERIRVFHEDQIRQSERRLVEWKLEQSSAPHYRYSVHASYWDGIETGTSCTMRTDDKSRALEEVARIAESGEAREVYALDNDTGSTVIE